MSYKLKIYIIDVNKTQILLKLKYFGLFIPQIKLENYVGILEGWTNNYITIKFLTCIQSNEIFILLDLICRSKLMAKFAISS